MLDDLHPTKSRLLDAAEAIFAAKGYDGTSLRAILIEAGHPGQLALIRYHFGAKADLYRAVWVRAMQTGGVEASAATEPAGNEDGVESQLRRVVQTFLRRPASLGRSRRGKDFLSIMLQEMADPRQAERGLVAEFLAPNAEEMERGLANLLPSLTEVEVRDAARLVVMIARTLMDSHSNGRGASRRSTDSLTFTTELVVKGLLGVACR